eukprot:COSAG01_NODE_332_length_18712_cov_41.424358_12_plen_58_part_00
MKWSKLSQPELRALLAAFDLPTSGGKAALVARVASRVGLVKMGTEVRFGITRVEIDT